MKKILLATVFAFSAYFVSAQDGGKNGDIPQNVSSTFQEEFPDVAMEDVEWESEDFHYKAEFEKDGHEYEARIDKAGNLISKETELETAALPEDLHKGLTENDIQLDNVGEVRMMETPQETLYKVEVDDQEQAYDAYFDKDGNLVNRIDS